MTDIYDKYRSLFIEFFSREKLSLVLLGLVLAGAYGFTVTNFSVGVDDVSFDRYLGSGGGFLAQGRFGPWIFGELITIQYFSPFLHDFVAVLLFGLSAILWGLFFRSVCPARVNPTAVVIFTTILVSYPIINEIFIYMVASMYTGLGYSLGAGALILSYEYIFYRRSWKVAATAVLLAALGISFYESFVGGYICSFFAALTLRYCCNEQRPDSLRDHAKYIAAFFLIIILGLVLKMAISAAILKLYTPREANAADNIPLWIDYYHRGALKHHILKLPQSFLDYYFFKTTEKVSSVIFALSNLLAIFIAAMLAIRKRDWVPVILVGGLIGSNLVLTILRGAPAPMRAASSFAIFIGFVWMLWYLLAQSARMKAWISAAVFVLVLHQVSDLNRWFVNDYYRYQQDKTTVLNIARELEKKCDLSKPVLFVGSPKYPSPNIMQNETNGISVITWGIKAFKGDSELHKFFDMHGYRLVRGTDDQRTLAQQQAKSLPAWPKEGSVVEMENFNIVNFGEPEHPTP